MLFWEFCLKDDMDVNTLWSHSRRAGDEQLPTGQLH